MKAKVLRGYWKVTNDMHVDELVNGGENINEVKKLKADSISLFRKGWFNLYMWHSNKTILETNDPCNTAELNFVRQQLGTKANKTKIIGIFWDKETDSFIIEVPNSSNASPKGTYCKHKLQYMTH